MFASLGFFPYRSTDNGASWTQLTKLPYQTISMAVDAVNPDIVYSAVWTVGVYRSLDGGDTWRKTADQPVTYSPNAIAASPTALYLATSNGVVRSTDGGIRWSHTSIAAAADVVAIDPKNPKTVYAVADQVYVSTDDGSTWTPLLTVPLHSVATIAPTSAGLFIGSVLPQNIFITKWNASGSQMLWSTYLGGSYSGLRQRHRRGCHRKCVRDRLHLFLGFPHHPQCAPGQARRALQCVRTEDQPRWRHDPVLNSAGGSSGGDSANAIAVDSAGEAYITGYTGSADFPVTPSALETTLSHGCAASGAVGDAFVSKLGPNGDALLYSTYLGGTCADRIRYRHRFGGQRLHRGRDRFPHFPGTATRAVYSGQSNIGFLAKLTPRGDILEYATFLGTGWGDVAQAVAVDQQRNAYVTGSSFGLDAPQPGPGFFGYGVAGSPVSLGSGGPAFVAKFGPSGARVYATSLGSCLTPEQPSCRTAMERCGWPVRLARRRVPSRRCVTLPRALASGAMFPPFIRSKPFNWGGASSPNSPVTDRPCCSRAFWMRSPRSPSIARVMRS